VLSLEGALVFTLASGLIEDPVEPGPLELSVEIPSLPLRRGNYSIDLYLMTHLAQDFLTGAIEFEVAGTRGGVEDPRHARDYFGLVDVEHEWAPVRQPGRERSQV
jgi:hypothetical protein